MHEAAGRVWKHISRAAPIGCGLPALTQTLRQRERERASERAGETYIGQRAHSAIQSQKPSSNTYYSCPFSQSGNLKPSSFRKPSGRGLHQGRGLCFFPAEVYNQLKVLIFLPDKTHTQRHVTSHKQHGISTRLQDGWTSSFRNNPPLYSLSFKNTFLGERLLSDRITRSYVCLRRRVFLFSLSICPCYKTVLNIKKHCSHPEHMLLQSQTPPHTKLTLIRLKVRHSQRSLIFSCCFS